MIKISIWDKRCYESVNWNETVDAMSPHCVYSLGDSTLADKKRKGEIIKVGAEIAIPAILAVISPLYGIISAGLSASIAIYERYETSEKRRIEEVYNEIFPIKGKSNIGIGEREPWMISDKKLNRYDIGAVGYILEGIAYGFSLVQAKPKEVKERKIVDFKNNLYVAGGPVPNAYSRNVLYGKAIQIPYKFRLDLNDKLANSSPLELKKMSCCEEPNWYICNENGKEIEGGVPKIENENLITDSFLVLKCQNIHPRAGKNTKSVIFAGCHGPGTSAAGALMKNERLVSDIYDEVEDNDFQLIGQVSVKHRLFEYEEKEVIDEKKIKIIDIQTL